MIDRQQDRDSTTHLLNRAQWVALSQIPGLSSRTIDRLIAHTGSLAAVFDASEGALRAVPRVGSKTATAIQQTDLEAVQHDITRWQAAGVEIWLRDDPSYPAHLAMLENAPVVLFWRGQRWQPPGATVAVVGTRQPSQESRALASAIASDLAHQGVTVISGLAAGIDTAAHTGALNAAGRTFAVLGSGVLVPYPPQNVALAKEIQQNGALLSEVRPDSKPSSHVLVARNRLISGMADAVVVVETSLTGGSMHAARFAQTQNRPVCAIDNGASGNQQLLANGALALPIEGWQTALYSTLRVNYS